MEQIEHYIVGHLADLTLFSKRSEPLKIDKNLILGSVQFTFIKYCSTIITIFPLKTWKNTSTKSIDTF